MDLEKTKSLTLANEAETTRLGVRLAAALAPGDLVTLAGQLGVGKSHLSRAIIRSLLQDPMAEVPSPSYTLVNVYQAGALEIWHADLYRLGDVSELYEIGLDEAVDHALVLVEWPDRWPDLPSRRLDLHLAFGPGESRTIETMARGDGWDQALTAVREAS